MKQECFPILSGLRCWCDEMNLHFRKEASPVPFGHQQPSKANCTAEIVTWNDYCAGRGGGAGTARSLIHNMGLNSKQ